MRKKDYSLLVMASFFSITMFMSSCSPSRLLYVGNERSSTIDIYDSSGKGDLDPWKSLGSKSRLYFPEAVATDPIHNEIFVVNGNGNDFIAIYKRTSNGDIAPVRTIEGPGTMLSSPTNIAIDPVHDEIFVINHKYHTSSYVTVYKRTESGNAAPLRTFQRHTGNGFLFYSGIAVDSIHEEVWLTDNTTPKQYSLASYSRTATGVVAPLKSIETPDFLYDIAVDTLHDEIITIARGDHNISRILVYSRIATGNAAPLRVISGDKTGMTWSFGLALDTIHDRIFVTNILGRALREGSITVYERTANGNVAPLQKIKGAATMIVWPDGIAVDPLHNEIIVAHQRYGEYVATYGLTSEGNTAPVRMLAGDATGLRGVVGMAIDEVNKEIFALNFTDNSVSVYEKKSGRNVRPLRTIIGPETGINQPTSIALGEDQGELFVTNRDNSITVYPRMASSNASPRRRISGPSTGLHGPWSVAIDSKQKEIFVANSNNSITVYNRAAQGDVAPLRTIYKHSRNIPLRNFIWGITVDSDHGEIYLASYEDHAIFVFDRLASGEETPLRVITGTDTKLNGPVGVAIDNKNNEIYVSNNGNDSITVYQRTANGNHAPLRTIIGPGTGLAMPRSIIIGH